MAAGGGPLGSGVYTTLAAGTAQVTSGVLAQFDPPAVENGSINLPHGHGHQRPQQPGDDRRRGRYSRQATQYLRSETDLTVQLDGARSPWPATTIP